ncbi:DUF4163 domain-containing protein [Paenibacillus motobuensis]|uniref:PdaC/SigV domain-containing protein n=1 Tax=Paenibacillus TaxID=44249 RepID=UPI00203BFB77|nr:MULTISPECIES: DUF4163 domain-containing protein [Paenibacillus]MCM3041424.1 DUF4163 domain-containing protein [Paenibacillus lutimineralis]MCM3648528.1 DUF4163 domain-containing protein [Paenibacillus motobuensis]
MTTRISKVIAAALAVVLIVVITISGLEGSVAALAAASDNITGETGGPATKLQGATMRNSDQEPAYVQITLKGKPLKLQGIQGQQDVLVPLELIERGLKVKVKYDKGSNRYFLRRDHVVVQLTPKEDGAWAVVNGSTQVLPYEWKELNGQPYVSVKVLTDHLGFTSTYDASKKTLDLVPHKLNNIRVTTRVVDKSIPEATIKMEYPQVGELKNKTAERKINGILQSKTDEFIKQSLQETKAGPPVSGHTYQFLGNYTVTFNRDGLLSILLQYYSYTGGAHGNPTREGLTFRLSDGKLLTLDEVLKDNPDYRKIVDPAIAKQLEATEGYFGGFKTIGENPSYYLKNDGVVIFLPLYEYLPYVNGFPEFYFPFSELGVKPSKIAK